MHTPKKNPPPVRDPHLLHLSLQIDGGDIFLFYVNMKIGWFAQFSVDMHFESIACTGEMQSSEIEVNG